MCGLHSEGKHQDCLASLQRSIRAEVERDTVVVQRIPPLYLYLRLKMRRTIRSTGCYYCLDLMESSFYTQH